MTLHRLLRGGTTIRPLLSSLLLTGAAAQAQDGALLPPDAAVGGRGQANWSQVWWQWAGSFEHDVSPVADASGFYCASRQSGEVWFLAGSFGTQRTIRRCVVPRGKHLFFPLLTFVVFPQPGRDTTCMSAMAQAAAQTDKPSALILELDGRRFEGLDAHRQATIGCFDLGALMTKPQKIAPSAANGYYVMLRPLTPGTHTLNFGGVLPDQIQAVTYTITVE